MPTKAENQRAEIRDILANVTRRFEEMQPAVDRMDDDFQNGWRMDEFIPDQEEGIDPEDAYTTNQDRAAAQTLIDGIAAADIVIRVPNGPADEEREDANDNTERLSLGFLALANKRLEDVGDLGLLEQLSWFAVVRGKHVCIRSRLLKNDRDETIPDMLPLDPRNLAFRKGIDGLLWSAYKMERTRADIRDDYKDFTFSTAVIASEGEDGDQKETVYDYHFVKDVKFKVQVPTGEVGEDGQPVTEEETKTIRQFWNSIIIDQQYAKEPANTHALRFPVIVRAVGYMPVIAPFVSAGEDQTVEDPVNETVAEAGDSYFALNRIIRPKINRLMSYALSAAGKETDPPYVFKSPEGTEEFDESPMRKGAGTSLTLQQELAAVNATNTGAAFNFSIAQASRDMSAGSLPDSALIGTPPPGGLSAAALSMLGGTVGQRTRPFLKPVESALLGALEVMVEQFETGAYEPIRVFGKTLDNVPFDRPIGAEHIQEHGTLTLKLKQNLPRDNSVAWATAQLAITPNQTGDQLASVQWARDNLLDMADSRLEDSRITLGQAKSSAPILQMKEMREDAARRSDFETAQYLDKKITIQEMREFLEDAAVMFQFQQIQDAGGLQALLAAGGPPQPNGQQQQGSNGVNPIVSPDAQSNVQAGTQPSPNAGANSTAPRNPAEQAGLTPTGA